MAAADRYLFEGELILASFSVKNRELAATGSRVIYTGPGKFRDAGYDFLASVGCGSIYKPAWAWAAFAFAALAIAFARAAAFVPESLSFGPFGVGLGWLSSLVGFPGVLCGAAAIVTAVIFLLTARMGITLQTPGGRLVFGYGRERHDEAIAFTKAVRAMRCRKP